MVKPTPPPMRPVAGAVRNELLAPVKLKAPSMVQVWPADCPRYKRIIMAKRRRAALVREIALDRT
jgi:hypothetical protein